MSGRPLLPMLCLVIASYIITAPGMVQAQNQANTSAGMDYPRDPIAIYEAAGASPSQLDTIKQLVRTFNAQQKVRAEKLLGLVKDMHALSSQVDPDRNAVIAKQDEINSLHSEMANERVKVMLDIRGVLNQDQKQKLIQILQAAVDRPQASTGASQPGGLLDKNR